MEPSDHANLGDLPYLMAPKPFIAKFGENLGMTDWSIEEQLRHRHDNGMIDSGAAIEIVTRDNQQRFKTLIHILKYPKWLTDRVGAVRRERERIKQLKQSATA